MSRLLSVDDDRSVHALVRHAVDALKMEVVSAFTADDAFEALAQHPPDVVLLDLVLPDHSGLEIFARIREQDPHLPVIFITGSGTSDTAIEAMKLGAFDYVHKPINLEELELLVKRALDSRRLASVPVDMRDILVPKEKGDAIVGRCLEMQNVFKEVGRVASQNIPVLILGESGTGKELVARALFQHGGRSQGPFLAVNCAALAETLLESELFGHEKGAFTGAENRRIGKFEQCSGGTIFLDEIGDMTPRVQSKLLRLLQEQKFERVGGNETITTDVRIISATNRDLEKMCRDGQFRKDLFYRLNGFTITLPPLRERGDDRVLLLQHFLARLNKELGREVEGLAPDALQVLLGYPWPGNIRELQSVLKQAMLRGSGPVLMVGHLPEDVTMEVPRSRYGRQDRSDAGPPIDASLDCLIDSRLEERPDDLYSAMLAWMETRLLARVLRFTRGNQSEAARILGITRGSLRNKVRDHNISVDRVVNIAESNREANE